MVEIFQNRKLRIVAAIAAILFGSTLFVHTAVHALWYAPEEEITNIETLRTLGLTGKTAETTDSPVKIIIPNAGVNADVVQVGISFKGNMSAPYTYTDTGWYKYGTVPGEVGSSVINGHADNGFAQDAVFKYLKNLTPGDDVYVETENGKRLHFVVERTESYPYQETPMRNILTSNGTPRLTLITCDGSWLPEAGTNDRRLVVYTKLVEN